MTRFPVFVDLDQTAAPASPAASGSTIVSLGDPGFGVDFTGVADSTAGIRAAIAQLKARGNGVGGVIEVPHGTILHGPIPDLAQTPNITFRGEGGGNGNYQDWFRNTSRFIYTGTSDARVWDCRSSWRICFEDLALNYNSNSWNGILVDYSHDVSAQDAQRMRVQRCSVGGILACKNASKLIYLDGALEGKFRDNQFYRAQCLVYGRSATGAGYSQPMTFEGNEWSLCDGTHILNPGDQWGFRGDTAEALSAGGDVGHPIAWMDTDWPSGVGVGAGAGSVTLDRLWCGDDFGFIQAWVRDNPYYSIDLTVLGGLYSGGAGYAFIMNGGKGIVMIGANVPNGVDFGAPTAGHGHFRNILLANDFGGHEIANRDNVNHLEKLIFGNFGARDEIAGGFGTNGALSGGLQEGKLPSSQQSGASYTFVITDAESVVESTGAGAAAFTIPRYSTVPWPVGTTMQVHQYGAGQVTITAGAGVTLRSDAAKVKTAGQYASIALRHRAQDEWVLSGDLA